ncbi:hypothetical protein M426DRAFT_317453 [Hypoxylon sp. CI-4A]|nr:hypothetical protein M426DRAFT_317453 [Hypoxylon sp. CI-4A]
MEEQITRALKEIQDRFPGFEILEKCYNADTGHENDLRKKILLAHLAFVELAVNITEYYLRHGYRRWMDATFRSNKFKGLLDRANERVLAVRLRCEELINLNITQMKQDMKQMIESNKELQKTVDEARLGAAYRYIKQLLELLRIPSWSPTFFEREVLRDYRQRLQSGAHYEQGIYERITYENVADSRLGDAFSQWSAGGRSSMLILTGMNNTNISELTPNCWLSPLAVGVADRERDANNPHAFFLFRGPKEISINTAIPTLVAQLLTPREGNALEPHEQTLTSHAERFSRLVESHGDTEYEMTDVLRQLLCDTINIFREDQTVTLVVDRLDVCTESERYDLLRILAEVLTEARCVVKILVVAGWTRYWRPKERELRAILNDKAALQLEFKEQRVLG